MKTRGKAVVLGPMGSAAQEVTEDFYTWELRGRGWALASAPVELEPPFRVCTFRRAAVYDLDDGRVPRIWERLASLVVDRKADKRLAPPAGEEEVALVPALLSATARTCLRVSIAESAKLAKGSVQRLLANLGQCSSPVSAEFIGRDGQLLFQLAVARENAAMLEPLLRAFLPDATIAVGHDLMPNRENADTAVVDFGLSDEFMLPVSPHVSADAHPLTGLLAALANLQHGEASMFQVLFAPTRAPWAAEMTRAVAGPTGDGVFEDAPWMAARASEKIQHPLFAACARLCAWAEEPGKAWAIVRNAASGMPSFAPPQGNAFIPLPNDGYPDLDHVRDVRHRVSRRAGMILNAEELAALVYPLDGSLRIENVGRATQRTKAAPARLRNSTGTTLGTNRHRGEAVLVRLSVEDRLRHVHCLGATGSGKTTLLQHMIEEDIEAGFGVAVLDPHGDLVDVLAARVPASRVDDVALMDPSLGTGLVPINLLEAHSEGERAVLAADLVGIFRRFATSWGDQMSAVLGNAIEAVMGMERGGTLLDLRRFLLDADFRNRVLADLHDEETIFFWRQGFRQIGTRAIGPLLTRLDMFLRPKPVRAIVAGATPALDVPALLDSGGILLARLAQGAIGEENAYLLGSLIAAKLNQAALQREKLDQQARRPFFLYVDEAHQLASPSMASILSGGRKFGLGLVASHQSLDQVRSLPELSNALIGNAHTRICFRLGESDAERMAGGGTGFSADDFRNLKVGEAIVRVGEASAAFNVEVAAPVATDVEAAREAKARLLAGSAARYQLPREAATTVDPLREKRAAQKPVPWSEPIPPAEAPTPATAPKRAHQRAPEFASSAQTANAGKGGRAHQYLQALVKRLAEEQGLKATLEGSLSGAGQVDVLLERDGIAVVFEISVTTEAEHDRQKVRKCIEAGCAHVVVVAAKPPGQAARYKAAVLAELSDAERQKVSVLAPEDVPEFIGGLGAPPVPQETVVKGYRVKVSHGSLPPQEAKARRERLARVIAQSLAERGE
jgi:DNA helicase HerA-like ATPase